MLKHRGKILEPIVRKWCDDNGWTIVSLSRKIGQHPSTTYRQFEKEDLPFSIIRKFGKAMNHDFRVEYPEMEDENIYNEPDRGGDAERPGYQPITLLQCMTQRDSWRDKYYDLLEKHNRLLLERLNTAESK